MKLFNCNSKTISLKVIDLPRSHWRLIPPRKWQTVLTVVGIIAISILWALA
jgi:hypothetical protein